MKKFKTLEEEIKYWASLTREEKQAILNKKIEKDNARRLKSEMQKMDTYLRSGGRTY